MSNKKSKLIQKFRESVTKGEIPTDLKVTYRVTSGMPSERLEEQFTLLGGNEAKVLRRNMLNTAKPQEGSSKLQPSEARTLLQQIAEGIDSLVTRSEAQFLPDSLVGTLTIEINGNEETFYFLVDEEDRLMQKKEITPQISQAIKRISNLSNDIITNSEVKNE